jgi:two-component system sensor histidine kinase UhpB
VLIVADPSDEIGEVWSTAKTQAVAGGGLALVVLFTSSLFIRWALRPLTLAGDALARLQTGDYSARIEPKGSPEFVDTCLKINSLAGSLSALRATNEELIQRLLDVQDAERKAVAHELHDEIGPHLFALRAKAAVLASRLEKDGLGLGDAAAAISIRDQIEALQGHNRRILARLRPVALEELGLIEARAPNRCKLGVRWGALVRQRPRPRAIGPLHWDSRRRTRHGCRYDAGNGARGHA